MKIDKAIWVAGIFMMAVAFPATAYPDDAGRTASFEFGMGTMGILSYEEVGIRIPAGSNGIPVALLVRMLSVLTSIVLQLQSAKAELAANPHAAHAWMETAIAMARDGLSEARRALRALRPDLLLDEPFHRAVERVVKEWEERSGVTAESNITGLVRALSSDVEHTLLRCLQEALANVQNHVQAGSVTVTLSYIGGDLNLYIQDDGLGFDISAPSPTFGLHGMRERIEAAGGWDDRRGPDVSGLVDQARSADRDELSRREVEVLMLVAQGKAIKEIARNLRLSEATVKSHLLHIFEKLGAAYRTHAVTIAVQRGIIRLD